MQATLARMENCQIITPGNLSLPCPYHLGRVPTLPYLVPGHVDVVALSPTSAHCVTVRFWKVGPEIPSFVAMDGEIKDARKSSHGRFSSEEKQSH